MTKYRTFEYISNYFLSNYLSKKPSIYLFIYLSIQPSNYLTNYLPILSNYLSIDPSILQSSFPGWLGYEWIYILVNTTSVVIALQIDKIHIWNYSTIYLHYSIYL